MTPETLDQLCAQARQRLAASINRSAAQHLRRFKEFCTKTPSSPYTASASSYTLDSKPWQ